MDEFDKLSQEALSEALAKQSQAEIKRHYEVLGLTTSASLEEVRERCKELVSTWHPDLYKDDSEKHKLATQKVQEFKEAYEAITKEAAKESTIIPPHQASTVNQADQSGASIQDTVSSKSFQTKAYEAILGENNCSYYLKKFEEFDRQAEVDAELKASWNWAAFFFGGTWALYRKMYGWFFVFLGIAFLSTILEKTASFGLGAIVLFIPRIAFSICANSLYHGNVKKKIAVAQLSIKDEFKQLEFLRNKGGVNTWVLWLIALLIGLMGGYLIYSIVR